jgi:hypothetical protein
LSGESDENQNPRRLIHRHVGSAGCLEKNDLPF